MRSGLESEEESIRRGEEEAEAEPRSSAFPGRARERGENQLSHGGVSLSDNGSIAVKYFKETTYGDCTIGSGGRGRVDFRGDIK